MGPDRLRSGLRADALLRALDGVRRRRIRRDAHLGPRRLPVLEAHGPRSVAGVWRTARRAPVGHGLSGPAHGTVPQAPSERLSISTAARARRERSTSRFRPDTL